MRMTSCLLPDVKIVFALAVVLCLLAGPVEAAARPLNVLFIAVDDLRNDLGCYGNAEAISPNIDRLAARGLVFNRAYCQQAVCNPSRASLLTGRRPDTLRIWDLPTHFRTLNPDVVALPQHFLANGYFTQDIGKIYHNWLHAMQGDPVSWSVPAVMHFENHGRDKPLVDGPIPPNLAVDAKCLQHDVPDEAYFDGRIANLAITALQERAQSEQPFFLAVGFWKPHAPFNAPKKYWDMFDREKVSMPRHPGWPIDAPDIARHDNREIMTRQGRKVTDDNVREMRHGYLANIAYLDAQVGKVLDELNRLKLDDSTVIVFWSDHGYHLGEQTLWAKTSNFELDARVPLIIAAPTMSAGKSTDALAELTDLYPTLVDICGLPAAEGVEGVSLVPVLMDPSATVRQAALTQFPRPAHFAHEPPKVPKAMGYSLRTNEYRYVEWRDWRSGEVVSRELYDHVHDPDETRNVAAQGELAAEIERCARLLDEFQPLVRPGWEPVLK